MVDSQPKKVELKKENSYTYWVRNTKQTEQQKEMNRPKQVVNEQTMQQIQQSNTSTGSAWNTGGTWENKKIKVD